jgi:Acetyl-CoA carboxylase beta subunit
MSNWFQRVKEGITTSTREKKETPEGLWHKCSNCKTLHTTEEIQKTIGYVTVVHNTRELDQKNISKSFLMTENMRSLIQISSPVTL